MPEIPIVVADFGLSQKGINVAVESGAEILTGFWKPERKSWFLKPEAVLLSPYEKTCWIDIDCEVVAPCPEIFDYAITEKIGLTPDHWAKRRGRAHWATGVIVVKGKPMILKEWATQCRKERKRGDQEVLYSIIGDSKDRVNPMPMKYQWLRLDLKYGVDSNSKKIIHWTGPVGKRHIRTLI